MVFIEISFWFYSYRVRLVVLVISMLFIIVMVMFMEVIMCLVCCDLRVWLLIVLWVQFFFWWVWVNSFSVVMLVQLLMICFISFECEFEVFIEWCLIWGMKQVRVLMQVNIYSIRGIIRCQLVLVNSIRVLMVQISMCQRVFIICIVELCNELLVCMMCWVMCLVKLFWKKLRFCLSMQWWFCQWIRLVMFGLMFWCISMLCRVLNSGCRISVIIVIQISLLVCMWKNFVLGVFWVRLMMWLRQLNSVILISVMIRLIISRVRNIGQIWCRKQIQKCSILLGGMCLEVLWNGLIRCLK